MNTPLTSDSTTPTTPLGPEHYLHEVGFWQDLLAVLGRRAPRARCGVYLGAAPGEPLIAPSLPCPHC
ncbi:hypothetical protein GCM10010174_80840 [Kutzneria viridogrisea]|uniref:Uncharacterized protein n=1 Tax=Kutzneria viridogrisea TaxID=47990 RepID=A0ABR6BZ04_9PSEU|nr:hypothetical protein [Kutzneria viridogrisea]